MYTGIQKKTSEKRKAKNDVKTTLLKKPRRLSNLDVSEFITENNIRSDTELLAKACEQQKAGKKDLAQFLLSHSSKSLGELIANTWKLQEASAKLERQTKSRMEILQAHADYECIEGCNGEWLNCATEVLRNNHVHPIMFSTAIIELMKKGRGKFRNIMIVGPANCAKTFLLSPLQKIFRTFSNPANDKYAWLGSENAELIFLNDFRWTPETIAWEELLLLLEGQEVHLPSPKNHYASDICINRDTPTAATGKSEITYTGKYNTTDSVENEMMSVRWKVFRFSHQISEADQREVPSCPACFCKLALLGHF